MARTLSRRALLSITKILKGSHLAFGRLTSPRSQVGENLNFL